MTIKTSNSPVIIRNDFGNYSVYPATIELAKKLLQGKVRDGDFPSDALEVMNGLKAFAANPDDLTIPYLVADCVVLDGMSDFITKDIGAESRALYRLSTQGTLEDGATLPITKALRDEFVLWAFDNEFVVKSAGAADLERTRPEKYLSFMTGLVSRANGHPIKYVYASDLESADELKQLLHGKWKSTAKVENVVQRYLTFINDICHRDEHYYLGVFHNNA